MAPKGLRSYSRGEYMSAFADEATASSRVQKTLLLPLWGATLDQRVAWHLAHLNAWRCRSDLPASDVAELERRGVRQPPKKRREPLG